MSPSREQECLGYDYRAPLPGETVAATRSAPHGTTAAVPAYSQVLAARDRLVRMVQRRWRRRMWNKRNEQRGDGKNGGPSSAIYRTVRPTTEAYSFSPPGDLSERMMLCTAWAYLRRGGLLVREV